MNFEAIAAPAAPAPEAGWQRWLVMVLTTVGVLLAAYALTLLWVSADTPLKAKVFHSISVASSVAMFGVSWLIAWRAGHSVANLSIALALTAISINDTSTVALMVLGLGDTQLYDIVNAITFIAGAGLFIRASQCFPRLVTADLIAASPTRLGKMRAARAALTSLLKPSVLWPLAIILAAVSTSLETEAVANIARLTILAIGIANFYLNYRAGEADVQRQVLWFLAAVVGVTAVSVIGLAASVLLGDEGSTFRTVVVLTLQSLSSLALIVGVAAAVFYAGAVSPKLVIRKTVVYGLTTALLLFVFASVEVYLHHQIVHFLHVTDTLASSLIGGVFGLTFHPVKHYFETLLGRFQGKTHSH